VFNNEKGSIPMVLILIFITMLTVFTLTNTLLAERTNIQRYDEKFEKEMYQVQTALEIAINITQQNILEKETDYKHETFHSFTTTDLQEVQHAINNGVLPFFLEDFHVELTDLSHTSSVDLFCEEVFEIDAHTNQSYSNGVECDKTYYNFSYNILVSSIRGEKKFGVIYKNLFPYQSQQGKIKTNTDSIKIEITN
jgi:hypothetical protein